MSRLLWCFAGLLVLAGCATAVGEKRAQETVPLNGPAPAPAFLASDFVGKAGAELDALLGEADLTRIEGAGEYRNYRLADCALIVILYPDESGVKRVRSIDAGALISGEPAPDLDGCLAQGKAKHRDG